MILIRLLITIIQPVNIHFCSGVATNALNMTAFHMSKLILELYNASAEVKVWSNLAVFVHLCSSNDIPTLEQSEQAHHFLCWVTLRLQTKGGIELGLERYKIMIGQWILTKPRHHNHYTKDWKLYVIFIYCSL